MAEIKKEVHWISVKDRLPEDGTRVLAYCPKIQKYFVGIARISGHSDNVYWWHEGARGAKYNVTSKVTHWLPLPEPPEVSK